MKRNIYYLILLLTVSAMSTSCKLEEDDIFSESAAVRLNNAKAEYKSILSAASNGWKMEYFATPASEGFTFLMKFDSSELVTVAAKNQYTANTYKTENSLYDVITDNGPVLTFNSYNTLLHYFSNPENPDGAGLEGDYEFIVLKADSNLVSLKGKKRGTYIKLSTLPRQQNWNNYMLHLDSINTSLFSGSTNKLNLIIGKDSFYAVNGTTGIFKIITHTEDPLTDGVSMPFIITSEGLRLYSNYTDGDKALMNFKLSADNQKLECTDANTQAYFSGPNPSDYFMSDAATWSFTFTKPMGTNFKAIYDKIVANCKSKLKESFTDLWLKMYTSSTTSYYALSFKSGKYTGNYKFSRTITTDGKVHLNYEGVTDTNGTYYLKNIAGFDELLKYMSQNFSITADCGLNVSKLHFSSDSEPSLSFYTTKQ